MSSPVPTPAPYNILSLVSAPTFEDPAPVRLHVQTDTSSPLHNVGSTRSPAHSPNDPLILSIPWADAHAYLVATPPDSIIIRGVSYDDQSAAMSLLTSGSDPVITDSVRVALGLAPLYEAPRPIIFVIFTPDSHPLRRDATTVNTRFVEKSLELVKIVYRHTSPRATAVPIAEAREFMRSSRMTLSAVVFDDLSWELVSARTLSSFLQRMP